MLTSSRGGFKHKQRCRPETAHRAAIFFFFRRFHMFRLWTLEEKWPATALLYIVLLSFRALAQRGEWFLMGSSGAVPGQWVWGAPTLSVLMCFRQLLWLWSFKEEIQSGAPRAFHLPSTHCDFFISLLTTECLWACTLTYKYIFLFKNDCPDCSTTH